MRNCCPNCSSKAFVKNGLTRHGDQNYKCSFCARQFVLNPKNNSIPEEMRGLVDRLLLERLSLEGICRAPGVSQSWLLQYISQLYRDLPNDLNITIPNNFEVVLLTRVQADELWSFVGNKKNGSSG